jgi:hypothetical protein
VAAELGTASSCYVSGFTCSGFERGYAQRMRGGSKVVLIAVLAMLIVVNLVLLILLFRPDRVLTARPSQQDPGDGSSPTATSSPASTPSASASGDQMTSASPDGSTDPMSSTGPVEAVPAKRLLLATSSTTAWRATIGDCTAPGEIEQSTTGGASWKRIVAAGSAPIVRLGTEPSGLFTIGGAGQRCSARYLAYDKHGAVTASRNAPLDMWYLTPDDRDEVNGPEGAKSRPCQDHIVGLATLDSSRALVVCADGAAIRTSNSGGTWQEVARVPNTLAVAAGDGRYWLARSMPDCHGIAVDSAAVKGTRSSQSSMSCVPADGVTAGEVALDVTDGAIWVWAGSKTEISTDGGRTWT